MLGLGLGTRGNQGLQTELDLGHPRWRIGRWRSFRRISHQEHCRQPTGLCYWLERKHVNTYSSGARHSEERFTFLQKDDINVSDHGGRTDRGETDLCQLTR